MKAKVSEIIMSKTKKQQTFKQAKIETDYKIFICGHPNTGKNTLARKILEK